MIQALDTETIQNPLYIMDRGYPAADLLERIEDLGQHHLMRCDKTFIRTVERSGADVVVEHKFSHIKRVLRFRAITVTLETGDEEYLITNLFDEELSIDDFAALYRCRLANAKTTPKLPELTLASLRNYLLQYDRVGTLRKVPQPYVSGGPSLSCTRASEGGVLMILAATLRCNPSLAKRCITCRKQWF